MAVTVQGIFAGIIVDWSGSFSSDHALLRLPAHVQGAVHNLRTHCPTKFDTDLDPDEWDLWCQILNDFIPSPDIALPTAAHVDDCVDAIHMAFHEVCTQTMRKIGNQPVHRSHWLVDEQVP